MFLPVRKLMQTWQGRERKLFRELRKRYIQQQHVASADLATRVVMEEVNRVYASSVLPLEEM